MTGNKIGVNNDRFISTRCYAENDIRYRVLGACRDSLSLRYEMQLLESKPWEIDRITRDFSRVSLDLSEAVIEFGIIPSTIELLRERQIIMQR